MSLCLRAKRPSPYHPSPYTESVKVQLTRGERSARCATGLDQGAFESVEVSWMHLGQARVGCCLMGGCQ